ncbi:MAG: metalloregulator ArsR/SmtB family transcription factor [Chloroflexota bacterium]|nr:metalloregulator ArsR/SmtB family transcription factor [Chloroflexota bacterium]
MDKRSEIVQQTGRSELTAIDPQAVAEARTDIPGEAVVALVVETFEALADPTRARILYALSKRRLCVRDLAILVGVSQSAVSHQLRFLRTVRLVKGEREGTTIFYSLMNHHLDVLFREAEYHADHLLQGLPDHPYGRP